MPRSKPVTTKAAPAKPSPKSRLRPPLTDSDPTLGTLVYAVRAGVWASSELDRFLQPLGVTLQQFNILRTLYRDPDNVGLPTGTLGQYLMARVPDVPRLLDRLVKAGLVERVPSPDDRRVVIVRLTQAGLELIDTSTPGIHEHGRRLVAHMTMAELVQLHALLKKLYAGFPRDDR